MTSLRTTVPAALLAVLAPSVVALTASPASAAWTNATNIHGAENRLCKVSLDQGWRIRLRLNANNADHTHLGRLYRTRDGESTHIQVRAAAGEVSVVR